MEALPLLPESRALDDPEAVLLVDDCEPQLVELYRGLEQGMCPHDQRERSRGEVS